MASGSGIVDKDVVKYGLGCILKIIIGPLLPKYLCTSDISKNFGGYGWTSEGHSFVSEVLVTDFD